MKRMRDKDQRDKKHLTKSMSRKACKKSVTENVIISCIKPVRKKLKVSKGY